MHATSGIDGKARVGDAFPALELAATSGQLVTVPDPAGDHVHLQLRRFAGCPICNLHLRSIVARHDEIRSAGIREVVPATVGRRDHIAEVTLTGTAIARFSRADQRPASPALTVMPLGPQRRPAARTPI